MYIIYGQTYRVTYPVTYSESVVVTAKCLERPAAPCLAIACD